MQTRSLTTMSGRKCDVVTGVTIGEYNAWQSVQLTAVYPCIEAPGYKLEYAHTMLRADLIHRSISNLTTVHFFENSVRRRLGPQT